jgi:ferredoxin
VAAAPGRFVQRASGSAAVTEQVPTDEALLEAAEGCPVEAIRVFDVKGVVLAPEGL